jgi:hypothetical protein
MASRILSSSALSFSSSSLQIDKQNCYTLLNGQPDPLLLSFSSSSL